MRHLPTAVDFANHRAALPDEACVLRDVVSGTHGVSGTNCVSGTSGRARDRVMARARPAKASSPAAALPSADYATGPDTALATYWVAG